MKLQKKGTITEFYMTKIFANLVLKTEKRMDNIA